MLFNSYSFIFVYLPVVFAGTFWLGRRSPTLACWWLSIASLVFYGIWDARFVPLLLLSVTFNYASGYYIALKRSGGLQQQAKKGLVAAIAANLALLAYFKYANFFIDTTSQLLGTDVLHLKVVLPLGISFFTFTQIAFLVDVSRGIAREYNFSHYLLFVTYFPHLIAGPLIHHKQVMPQFQSDATYRIDPEHVAVGVTIFTLGLAKKVLLADNLAQYATPVFSAARDGTLLTFVEAWIGALAYGLQLYFDFSGYSDMAIGLSLMFNVRLPTNFYSPYKASSIIGFWRRWHMTLSAFLRDYLYIPLGGNRKGPGRRHVNLMVTMLLGGLWHGAGLTFIIWGGLQGFYLIVNQGWRTLKDRLGWAGAGRLSTLGSVMLTFLAVTVAWVFFRADSVSSALAILSSMAGLNGIVLPPSLEGLLGPLARVSHLDITYGSLAPVLERGARNALTIIAIGLAIVWFMPNVREMMARYRPTIEAVTSPRAAVRGRGLAALLAWRPTLAFAIATGGLFAVAVFSLTKVSEFLYYQF
ncbi:MAG: hypothetical protein JWO70_4519 [Betaproteobacteria bacterium]|nr:hypothetical protein [Betaproteobacteria bacterium]